MRRLLTLACFIVALSRGSATIVTIADISGDGSAHQIAASGSARYIQIFSLNGNASTNCTGNTVSGCVRAGDSNISTSRGFVLYPGGSQFFPQSDQLSQTDSSLYDLSKVYYLAQSGDKITINYVK